MAFFLYNFPLFFCAYQCLIYLQQRLSCSNADQGISEAGPSGFAAGGSETVPPKVLTSTHEPLLIITVKAIVI